MNKKTDIIIMKNTNGINIFSKDYYSY